MSLKRKKIEQDVSESDRFVDLARKLVTVPKKDVDARIAAKKQAKADANEKERKA